jgi:hypothetical protein
MDAQGIYVYAHEMRWRVCIKSATSGQASAIVAGMGLCYRRSHGRTLVGIRPFSLSDPLNVFLDGAVRSEATVHEGKRVKPRYYRNALAGDDPAVQLRKPSSSVIREGR